MFLRTLSDHTASFSLSSAQVVSSDGSVSSTAEQSKAVGSHEVCSGVGIG